MTQSLGSVGKGGVGLRPSDRCYSKAPDPLDPGIGGGGGDKLQFEGGRVRAMPQQVQRPLHPQLKRRCGFGAKKFDYQLQEILAGNSSEGSGQEGGEVPTGAELPAFRFSFKTWCMSLTRWILASRTSFSRFLGSTLCLHRDGPSAPLPLCFPCQFLMGKRLQGALGQQHKTARMRRQSTEHYMW